MLPLLPAWQHARAGSKPGHAHAAPGRPVPCHLDRQRGGTPGHRWRRPSLARLPPVSALYAKWGWISPSCPPWPPSSRPRALQAWPAASRRQTWTAVRDRCRGRRLPGSAEPAPPGGGRQAPAVAAAAGGGGHCVRCAHADPTKLLPACLRRWPAIQRRAAAGAGRSAQAC